MRRLPKSLVDTSNAEGISHEVMRWVRKTVRKPLIAFSGGKDSIVLAHICSQYGYDVSVRDNALTFYRVERQVREIAMRLFLNLVNIDRLGRDWPFYPMHRKYLFPDTKVQGQFYQIAQQTTIRRFADRGGFDGVMMGRRRQENCIPSQIYRNSEGVWQIMPLAHWTHEEIWSYIRHHRLAAPDIYETSVGIDDGCTTWNMISPEKLSIHPYKFIKDYCPETFDEITRLDKRVIELAQ